MATTFADLANFKAKDVKEPQPLPVGHYQAQFSGLMQEHKSSQKGTLAMRFPLTLLAPGDDVDQEELAASLDGKQLSDKKFTFDFWMSPGAMFRFTNFTKAMGLSDELNLLEQAEALGTGGEPFLIEVKHEPRQDDPTKMRMVLDNPTPLA